MVLILCPTPITHRRFAYPPACSMVIGRRQSGDSRVFFSGGVGVFWQVPYLASHRLVKQNLRGALPLRTPAPNTK